MIRVETGGRLHFGLLSLAAPGERWPDLDGRPTLPARRFGGVGLMVDPPALRLTATPAAAWSAEGPAAARALDFARRVAASCPGAGSPQRLTVEAAPPEHVGLGTGTQLGLAVARALAAAWGVATPALDDLARWSGRGLRSALGAHGFAAGGFLVESGQGASDGLGPLAVRLDFPAEWSVLLACPGVGPGLHGAAERQAFAGLTTPPGHADALCRLALLGLVPALIERDLPAFGEALHDFNRRDGEPFAAAQGGPYAGPQVAALVAWLRSEGVAGAGQSSWGPTVFCVVGGDDQAEWLARQARERFGVEAVVTRARNVGARLAYSFPNSRSTTQQPRTCGPGPRQWPRISGSVQPASSKASASTGRRWKAEPS
jgi:beta-RFAP synthase